MNVQYISSQVLTTTLLHSHIHTHTCILEKRRFAYRMLEEDVLHTRTYPHSHPYTHTNTHTCIILEKRRFAYRILEEDVYIYTHISSLTPLHTHEHTHMHLEEVCIYTHTQPLTHTLTHTRTHTHV